MTNKINMNSCLFLLQFVKFANIEEDTPSYHRSYDFFVSRFSEMCHSDHEDPDIKIKSVSSFNSAYCSLCETFSSFPFNQQWLVSTAFKFEFFCLRLLILPLKTGNYAEIQIK